MQLLKPLVLVLGFVLAVALPSQAQQDPMFTQYMNNILSINPAYAATGTALEMSLLSRNQWVGLEGAPVTNALSAQAPLKGFDAGIGVSILSDEIGPTKQTGIYFDYAFKVRVAYSTYLSMGVKGGINFFNTDYSMLEVNDGGDPLLTGDLVQKLLPNMGLGFYLYNRRMFVSLSAPKLLQNKINKLTYTSQFAAKEEIHLFVMAGYLFDLNRYLKFKPYALLKFVPNTPFSADLSAHWLFYQRMWLGVNWRVGDAIGAMAQVYATPQLKIGYAYDVTASDLNTFNKGTHEISLSYVLNMGRRRYVTPRFF